MHKKSLFVSTLDMKGVFLVGKKQSRNIWIKYK